jgi:DNA repair exonuclease SbcCD ATPase subunit
MKVHFTIEFPTRSGEPVDYENDVDVMNPKVTMQPQFGSNQGVPVNNKQIEHIEDLETSKSAPPMPQINEEDFKEMQEKMDRGELDNDQLKEAMGNYQKKNLQLVEQLHSSQMEVAKLKAMMKKAPDEQIEELLQENERLQEELKMKLQEQRDENQEDSAYLREEIKELRGKLKEKDERIESMVEAERTSTDKVIEYRSKAEKIEIELREEKAKMEEKYKHFEELNKYISDLLHEKKKLGLSMDEKTKQWQEMKDELEDMKKGNEEHHKKIQNEVKQQSLDENQKRWDDFQNKISEKDEQIEDLKRQLRLADQAMAKEGDEMKLVREAGENVLLRIEELEDICEIMNIDFERTDVNDLRTKSKSLGSEDYARAIQDHLRIISDRQQNIYNHLRG